jgi:hypothetical protein
VEVEANELFAQREATQQCIHHVSDIKNVGASNDSDSDDESDEDEFPDLADMDLSSGDTEHSCYVCYIIFPYLINTLLHCYS